MHQRLGFGRGFGRDAIESAGESYRPLNPEPLTIRSSVGKCRAKIGKLGMRDRPSLPVPQADDAAHRVSRVSLTCAEGAGTVLSRPGR